MLGVGGGGNVGGGGRVRMGGNYSSLSLSIS